jgi:hypothetical protein
MKKILFVFIAVLVMPRSTVAAWLLWKHSLTITRVEGIPRSIGPQGTVNKWELLNAVEARTECLATLRDEFKKSHEGLIATYPNTRISQSPIGNGVRASLSTGTQATRGASEKPVELFLEYTFWCLPTGVDPRMTTFTTEKK